MRKVVHIEKCGRVTEVLGTVPSSPCGLREYQAAVANWVEDLRVTYEVE